MQKNKDKGVDCSHHGMRKHENKKFLLIGLLSTIVTFLLLGIPTDTIPNQFYTRMVPSTGLDLFFLVAVSFMLGTYTGLFFYLRDKKRKPGKGAAYVGTAGGFLAISCPICIKFLVLIFGAVALMAYLEPLRPYIGFLSMGLMGFGIYREISIIRKWKN